MQKPQISFAKLFFSSVYKAIFMPILVGKVRKPKKINDDIKPKI